MPAAPQSRLRRGELATAASGLALLVAMFAVKWYGVDNIPGHAPSVVSTVDAWNGLSELRWVMLVTILLTLASVALHLSQGDHGSQTDMSLVVALAATLVAAGLVYRVLIALPEAQAIVDQKLGALLGLGCGLAMAVSAWQVRREVRAAARAPVLAHRRPRNRAAGRSATAAAHAAAPGGPPAGADAPVSMPAPGGPPAGADAPVSVPAPGGPPADPDAPVSMPAVAPAEPAEAETAPSDATPRRRRARTSRPGPT